MNRNIGQRVMRFRFFFLCLVVFVTLFFLIKEGRALYSYFSLSKREFLVLQSLEVEKIKDNHFVLKGNFEKGWQVYLTPPFRNRYIVEKKEAQFEIGKSYNFFYNPRKEIRLGRYKKEFPYKALFTSALLLCLLMYFKLKIYA